LGLFCFAIRLWRWEWLQKPLLLLFSGKSPCLRDGRNRELCSDFNPGAAVKPPYPMQISQQTVVAIDYTLTDDQGTVLDTSEGREPLYFLQGVGQIVSGLEEALEGKTAGEQFSVAIPPEKGYGLRNDSLIQQVPRDRFPAEADIEKGMQFRASSPEGPMMVTVTDVSLDFVMVDGNHPLAGQILNFAVDIIEVREATATELDHGHVHGPDDEHHH